MISHVAIIFFSGKLKANKKGRSRTDTEADGKYLFCYLKPSLPGKTESCPSFLLRCRVLQKGSTCQQPTANLCWTLAKFLASTNLGQVRISFFLGLRNVCFLKESSCVELDRSDRCIHQRMCFRSNGPDLKQWCCNQMAHLTVCQGFWKHFIFALHNIWVKIFLNSNLVWTFNCRRLCCEKLLVED